MCCMCLIIYWNALWWTANRSERVLGAQSAAVGAFLGNGLATAFIHNTGSRSTPCWPLPTPMKDMSSKNLAIICPAQGRTTQMDI